MEVFGEVNVEGGPHKWYVLGRRLPELGVRPAARGPALVAWARLPPGRGTGAPGRPGASALGPRGSRCWRAALGNAAPGFAAAAEVSFKWHSVSLFLLFAFPPCAFLDEFGLAERLTPAVCDRSARGFASHVVIFYRQRPTVWRTQQSVFDPT